MAVLIFLYGAETWTLRNKDLKQLETSKMKFAKIALEKPIPKSIRDELGMQAFSEKAIQKK